MSALPPAVVGSLLGLLLVAGLGLMVVGARHQPERIVKPSRRSFNVDRATWIRLGVGTVAGLVISALTGWPSLFMIAVGLVWFVPLSLSKRSRLAQDRKRLNAIASWVETFRDLIGGSSASVEQAIAVSADVAPSTIRPEINRLRLEAEEFGTKRALLLFSDRMADPVVDQIGWALLIASEHGGGSVSELLSQAAKNIRSMVMTRDKIEAERAKSWTTVTAITIVTLLLGSLMFAFQPTTRHFFSGSGGQVLLLFVAGLMFGSLYWIVKLSETDTHQRVPLNIDRDEFLYSGTTT